MTNAFPSEVFLSLLDNSKYDMYTSRILSETEESAEVELPSPTGRTGTPTQFWRRTPCLSL
jgi:hypothetical protein